MQASQFGSTVAHVGRLCVVERVASLDLLGLLPCSLKEATDPTPSFTESRHQYVVKKMFGSTNYFMSLSLSIFFIISSLVYALQAMTAYA